MYFFTESEVNTTQEVMAETMKVFSKLLSNPDAGVMNKFIMTA